jgi:hypothetical protein
VGRLLVACVVIALGCRKETAKIIPLGACAIGFGAYNAPFFRREERLAQPLVELSGFVKNLVKLKVYKQKLMCIMRIFRVRGYGALS